MKKNEDTVYRYNYKDLVESEWSLEFEKYMRNRLIVGAYRYGKQGSVNKPDYDYVNSAIKRLQKYQEDGNTENLVDVANMCLLEFVEGKHPKRHFAPVDDGIHTKEKGELNDFSKTLI